MTITETLSGRKFVERVRELESAGNRFEYVEMVTNSSWLIAYYSLPDDLFSTQQRNQQPYCQQKHESREAPPPAL